MLKQTQTHNEFDERVAEATGGPLCAEKVSIVQVNVGLVCNQQCVHCHVAASPRRREQMSRETMQHVLDVAGRVGCTLLDVTGGAPEIHPEFRWFVATARGALHVEVHRPPATARRDTLHPKVNRGNWWGLGDLGRTATTRTLLTWKRG